MWIDLITMRMILFLFRLKLPRVPLTLSCLFNQMRNGGGEMFLLIDLVFGFSEIGWSWRVIA